MVKDTVAKYNHDNPLSNPYPMANPSQRDAVCDTYDAAFKINIAKQGPLRKAVDRIIRTAMFGDCWLVCFCAAPEGRPHIRCHCDTIKKYADDTINAAYDSVM